MKALWGEITRHLAAEGQACLVTLLGVMGSAPREAGARMIVLADGRFSGTIGGGALEWRALAEAQKLIRRHPEGRGTTIDQALGPDLGQCCGGRVTLLLEAFASDDADWLAPLAAAEAAASTPLRTRGERDPRGVFRRSIAGRDDQPPDGGGEIELCGAQLFERFARNEAPLLLFGAGHVGRALVLALAPLPFAVRWIDARPGAFPAAFPGNVEPVATADAQAEIAAAARGSLVLALSHSHALDLEIAAAALTRTDLAAVGVIGSETKAARFRSRLAALGLVDAAIARLVCPVGLRSLRSKEPAVIAAGIAVQLLKAREAWLGASSGTAGITSTMRRHVER